MFSCCKTFKKYAPVPFQVIQNQKNPSRPVYVLPYINELTLHYVLICKTLFINYISTKYTSTNKTVIYNTIYRSYFSTSKSKQISALVFSVCKSIEQKSYIAQYIAYYKPKRGQVSNSHPVYLHNLKQFSDSRHI